MSETYEVLYEVQAYEIEPGDLIRFDYMDEDLNVYSETVSVSDVDYQDAHVEVSGYSETLNEKMQYTLDEDALMEVLGG